MNVLLIIFLVFAALFIVHSIFVVYHLLRFAIHPDRGRLIAGGVAGISVFLLLLAIIILIRIDWNAPLTGVQSGVF